MLNISIMESLGKKCTYTTLCIFFQVTVRRVVNVLERGASFHPPVENYDTGFEDDRWFDDDPMYTGEECPRDNNYPSERYFNDNPNYVSFHRNSPPHHQVRQDMDGWKHILPLNSENVYIYLIWKTMQWIFYYFSDFSSPPSSIS